MKNFMIGNIINTNSIIDCKEIVDIIPVEAVVENGEFKYKVSTIENKTHNMIKMINSLDEEFCILINKEVDTSILIDVV